MSKSSRGLSLEFLKEYRNDAKEELKKSIKEDFEVNIIHWAKSFIFWQEQIELEEKYLKQEKESQQS